MGLVEWAGSSTGTELGRQFHSGFVSAVTKLGLQADVREVSTDKDPGGTLAYFARKQYDLIVMGAFFPGMAEVVDEVALEFPQSIFLVPDYLPKPGRQNIQGFVLRVEEASYLAGHLAAQMEMRRPGRNMVSAVGGLPTAPVVQFIAGFQAGARKADPKVKILNGYSQDFSNPRKCQALALSQIAKGSGAIFDVAGHCGEGALAAAKAEGVYGIGVDADYAFLGPHILTSVVKHYDVALFRELRAFKNGTLPKNGASSFGLRDDAVGLGKISPRVPQSVLRQLDVVRSWLAAAKIRVPTKLR